MEVEKTVEEKTTTTEVTKGPDPASGGQSAQVDQNKGGGSSKSTVNDPANTAARGDRQSER